MKKTILLTLGVLIIVLVLGIIIPKILIKNPDLSSSPCAEQNVKAVSRFPLSLVRTAKVEKFSISSVDISYYTLFGIKLKNATLISCLLLGDTPLLGQTNVSQINGSSPLHAQKDSFDGHTYTNSTYGFSFDWNKQMYLSNIDPTASGLVTDTPGALAASGNLTMQTASGVAVITINKFTDLPKTQETFCEEQIKMNPGTTDCLKSINQAQLLQMKAGLLAKELTANIVQRGDKKDTTPQFIDIQGGVGVLSTLYDMNGGWWTANFTTLNRENDLIDIYLFRPNAKTPQELVSLPEYKTFINAMKSFKIY